jgi:hypothetical protein
VTGSTGPAGAPGATGPGGSSLNLEQAYDNTGTGAGLALIQIDTTVGPIVIRSPTANATGGSVFRIENASGGGVNPVLFEVRNPTAGALGVGVVRAPRLDLGGTPLTPGAFSLSRWGSGVSAANSYGITGVSGDDSHGKFTVVAGQTGYTINPWITLNFVDGPRGQIPMVLARVVAPCVPTAAPLWGYNTLNPIAITISPTNVTWIIPGTCTNRATVTVHYMIMA